MVWFLVQTPAVSFLFGVAVWGGHLNACRCFCMCVCVCVRVSTFPALLGVKVKIARGSIREPATHKQFVRLFSAVKAPEIGEWGGGYWREKEGKKEEEGKKESWRRKEKPIRHWKCRYVRVCIFVNMCVHMRKCACLGKKFFHLDQSLSLSLSLSLFLSFSLSLSLYIYIYVCGGGFLLFNLYLLILYIISAQISFWRRFSVCPHL